LYRWKSGVPGYIGGEVIEETEREGAYDIGMENDLLHHMRMIRNQEVYAVLKIIVEVWRIRLSIKTARKISA
jgi:hypothetical protein